MMPQFDQHGYVLLFVIGTCALAIAAWAFLVAVVVTLLRATA